MMVAFISPGAYLSSVLVGAVITAGLCVGARRRPGRWTTVAGSALGVLLGADALSWVVSSATSGAWSWSASLPLDLCDVAVLVAAAACCWRLPLLVELTWFWGMAGTLQAVITPDLQVAFPHLVFFQYVVGHIGIVVAALFLVVGLQITPRRRAVARTFSITVTYTLLVGVTDAVTGANYMFLRRPPPTWSLLSVFGPWPWYILTATGVALALVAILDLPFRHRRNPANAPGSSSRTGRNHLVMVRSTRP